jgi:hypothetical protein
VVKAALFSLVVLVALAGAVLTLVRGERPALLG